MNGITNRLGSAIILLCVLGCMSANGQTAITNATEEIVLREGLTIDGVGYYGRSPVHQDVVESLILSGAWKEPHDGDVLKDATGEDRTWRKTTADEEGWFSQKKGRSGYIYVRVDSDAARTMLLHMRGNSMAYVNGVPRVGSRYQYREEVAPWEPHFDYVQLPVRLKKGVNDLLFKRTWRSRGRVKVRLLKPKSPVQLNPSDVTLPDLLVGQAASTVGSIVVINSSDTVQKDLRITVSDPNQPSDQKMISTTVPIIQPRSVRKVWFPIHRDVPAKEPGTWKRELTLKTLDGARTVLDRCTVNLNVKKPDETHKRTFVSAIDGSVQYYAVNPVKPLPGDTSPPALVLSVHGASVEAINQAGSYGSKSWCNIVSPTNRRPYGFDWEDWGRVDALEVLEDAKVALGHDPERVYLTGHSMGGHGTWILGSEFPDKFAAIGPSAGWLSFWSYRAATKIEDPSPVEQILTRPELAGDTMTLAKNLTDTGVYILHGGADKVVRSDQSHTMIERLKTFHQDFVYHEEPGQGHWWDLSDEPGADCVDWAPMFDFFARHALPAAKAVRQVDFVTVNPGISAWSYWAGIEDQIEHLKLSTISIRLDPGKRRFVGTTENVSRLSLKLDVLPDGAPLSVQLDEQTLSGIPYPCGCKQIWLVRKDDQWSLASEPPKVLKGPHRFGPFKEAFRHKMVFVIGTAGSESENAWARTKARFDAEQWWYQGNGSVDIIADVDFAPKAYADRGVVLYGNSKTNAAWPKLLGSSPVQVEPGAVTIGDQRLEGDDLACLFLRPRTDSEVACVAVVSGTGIKGMHLTDRLQYIFAGCNYPDCIVIGPEMLTDGTKGVRAAGVFGSDWRVESGTFAWRDEPVTSEVEAVESTDLPAYIGPDPRPFVMPRGYVCQRARGPIVVDGKLDESSWDKAVWADYHVDIEGQMRPVKPRFDTHCKMLWDDQYFYVAAWMEEPHVWGTITERNAVIFNDNDFEVFIDPDGDSHAYYEFEINVLNTVWNLLMDKPYKHGGNAVIREMPGQKSGVFVKGTLNNPGDIDEYWTVEIAFPWKGMAEHATCPCPPKNGDQWRVGFSRVEWGHRIADGKYLRWPNKEERTDEWHEDNWIWSPQGVVNMHRPETWGYVQFSTKRVGAKAKLVPDPAAQARYLLHEVLYAQEQYHLTHKRYADTLETLDLGELMDETLAEPVTMRITEAGWEAVARLARKRGKVRSVHVRQDGKVWTQ